MTQNWRERRGLGGWDEVLASERHLVAPGSEWRSGLYRVAIEQREMWTAEEISTRLRKTMRAGMARVLDASEKTGQDWRIAAQILAIERVAEASRLRSIYP